MKQQLTESYVDAILSTLTPTLQLAKVKDAAKTAFRTKNFNVLCSELKKYQGASSLRQKLNLAELTKLVEANVEVIISKNDTDSTDVDEVDEVEDVENTETEVDEVEDVENTETEVDEVENTEADVEDDDTDEVDDVDDKKTVVDMLDEIDPE